LIFWLKELDTIRKLSLKIHEDIQSAIVDGICEHMEKTRADMDKLLEGESTCRFEIHSSSRDGFKRDLKYEITWRAG